jgi:alpha-galactosidase
VQMKHDAFSFRQDLDGFGEPSEGAWDGFQRINLDTLSGGLVGVFRHGAREPSRRAYVSWLAPDRRYAVRRIDGSEVLRATGRELRDTGWDVTIAALYGGELFEVSEAA